MARSKLSPWFINGEVPWEAGVYNVSCRKAGQTGKWWARWDGKTWYFADECPAVAARERHPTSSKTHWHKMGSWRGLAKKPKGAAQ